MRMLSTNTPSMSNNAPFIMFFEKSAAAAGFVILSWGFETPADRMRSCRQEYSVRRAISS
jgi:hypothetical protein